MKQRLLAVSGIVLFMTGVAFAEIDISLLDQRQTNQEQRIDQGIASGQLNDESRR